MIITQHRGSLFADLLIILAIFVHRKNGVYGQTIPAPCTSAQQLTNLNQRVLGYSGGQSHVGDYYIDADWYSMGHYVLARSNGACGATHPWHMEGDLPTDMKEATRTVCDTTCTSKKTIRVQKCQTNQFVFYLEPLDSNDMGYCIESLTPAADLTAPKINFPKPRISAEVLRVKGDNNLHFYCDFSPGDTKLLYTVEWLLTSGLNAARQIHRVESLPYDKNFRTATALNEDHLRAKNTHRLGITIMCSVTAQKDPGGAHSNSIDSDRKFCGIEILDKGLINLNTNDDKTIRIRSTVPFGCPLKQTKCTLNVQVFFPNKPNICELPSVKVIYAKRDPCGVTIYSDKYDEIHEFKLKRISGGRMGQMNRLFVLRFRTEEKHPDQPLFENYFLEEVRVNVLQDTGKLSGKVCHSFNDPHMQSFGGKPYENQTPGKYVFYKHNKYEVEVQLWTKFYTQTVALNCGIAIRAGRDVFVFSICEGRKEINFRICDDSILHRRVKQDGRNYNVHLPTGTIVTITDYGSSVNFVLQPSVEDMDNTDGLCGSLDNPNHVPNPADHRVSAAADLFEPRNYRNLKSWSETEYLCKCEKGVTPNENNELEEFAVCDTDTKTTCIDDRGKISNLDNVCAIARRKRQAHANSDHLDAFRHDNKMFIDWQDIHIVATTNFIGAKIYGLLQDRQHGISKRKVYDDATATRECMDFLNTTVYQKCSNLPHLDLQPYIDNCILDAKLTGGMEFASTHLEAIKSQCLYHVEVNQPLSPAAEAELASSWENLTDPTNLTQQLPTTSRTPSASPPLFTEDLLHDLTDIICPNECSGHGRCIKGECKCNEGYMNIDCSWDSSRPPMMQGIPDRGLCDRKQRQCRQTSVFGDNFIDTSTLSCRITPFTVKHQSEISYGDTDSSEPAIFMSVAEVKCKLPGDRRRRSIPEVTSGDVIATGYNVSVSNNGQAFSDADTLVVFDSTCVSCSRNSGRITCTKMPGFCVKGGSCYVEGNENGCDICTQGDSGVLGWTEKPGCAVPINDSSAKLWIIPAVLAPVGLIVLIAVGIAYCKYSSSRGRKTSSKVHLGELTQKKRRV